MEENAIVDRETRMPLSYNQHEVPLEPIRGVLLGLLVGDIRRHQGRDEESP